MAKRIPQLDAISGASTASDDQFVIFDTSEDKTKRISRSELATALSYSFANTFLLLTGGTLTGGLTVNVTSSNPALRVTQLGAGNAITVEDSANPDATPFVVDATGKVGVGTGSPAVSLDIVATDAIKVPVGLTGDRPTGASGYIRFNSSLTVFEGFNGTDWVKFGNGTITSITAGTGLTGGTITASGTFAIANTGVTAASYGSSSKIPVVTVNAQGQITSASESNVQAVTSIAAGTGLTGGTVTATGTFAIANTGVTAASYGSSTKIPVLAVNAQGQITSASESNVQAVTSITAGTGLTGGTVTATGTFALANSGVTAGSYGSATKIPSFVVDAYGRLTAAAEAALQAVTSLTAGTGLTGGTVTATGTFAIANTGVTAGSYGSATQIPSVTVNAQGQITAASSTALSAVTSITAGTGLTGGTVTATGTFALASSGVSAGTYGTENSIPAITVDTYGRVTTASTFAVNAVGLTTGTISTKPATANDITNKAYVDAAVSGSNPISPVSFVSTTDIGTFSIPTGGTGRLSGSGTAFLTIDGATPQPPARILVAGQTALYQNGIYTITNNSGTAPWSMTRAADYDTIAEISPGDGVFVTSGTANADSLWIQENTVALLNTSPIVFTKVPAGGSGVRTPYTPLKAVYATSTTALVTGTLPVTGGGTGLATLSASPAALYSTGTTTLVSGILPVTAGGTGGATATAARTALSAAASGTNTDITSVALTAASTSAAVPTVDTNIANKRYVDNIVSGLTSQISCEYATTTNLAATYNNTAGTLTSTTNSTLSVDGISPVPLGSRVLVKNQTTEFQNGVYVLTTLGSTLGPPWVLTRVDDYKLSAQIAAGDAFYIELGNTLANTQWVQQTQGTITVGTTPITFLQFVGSGSSAGIKQPYNANGAVYANSTTTLTTGTLPVSGGGTGLTTTPANGEILIGNGTGYTKATITQGEGITITNGSGTVTIANSGATTGTAIAMALVFGG
jgi:hypothetical protein